MKKSIDTKKVDIVNMIADVKKTFPEVEIEIKKKRWTVKCKAGDAWGPSDDLDNLIFYLGGMLSGIIEAEK